jgi:hypothetical protein
MHPATFINGEEFWCQHCDRNTVKSNEPLTGTFFSQFGHEWSTEQKKTTSEYTMVIFAYCPDCIKLLGLQTLINHYNDEQASDK